MRSTDLFSRTPNSHFVSPFGLSGVSIGADPAEAAVPWEAAPDNVDETCFGSAFFSDTSIAGMSRTHEVTDRKIQNLTLRTSDGSQPASDPMYEKEIRRAEAHLPGLMSCETTCRSETISIGEKMTKLAHKQQAVDKTVEVSQSETARVGGSSGKSGWGVISRNFAVSSALSSLNRDLKTFGTRPHEAVIDRERVEAVRATRFMITPGTVFHRRYSWLNVVLLIYCAFTIPVRVSFDFELGALMSVLEFVIDVFFMVDVFVNFRTGFVKQEDGEEPVVVTDAKMVARHYLRTWFCVDTLSAFPITFFLGQDTLGGANRVPRLIRIPRIIRLMRLVRLLRLLKLLQTNSVMDHLSSAGMHPRLLRALRLVFVTFIGSHATACCWHFLHTLATSEDPAAPSWWNTYCMTALPDEHAHIMCEVDLPTRYTISLYWAVTTLTTIGYGDILPVTFSEYVYTIFCMYVGVSFYAFIAANVATVLASLDTNTQLHNQKMDKLNEFLKVTKMPSSLRRRLRKYFSLYWTQLGALMPYDTRKLIEEINLPALRSEVTGALYKDMLARVPFLRNREGNFITNIVTKLVPLHVLEGELMVREGEVGTNIFFLFNGKVASTHRERTVKYMVPGSYFGDVAVLLTERHLVSFRAHKICDLYILSKDDLSYALQHFPHYTFEMRELAVSRLAAMNEDIENLNARASGTTSGVSTPVRSKSAVPGEGSMDVQSHTDNRCSSMRSSALSDMFDERLSERMNQLLCNDTSGGLSCSHLRQQHDSDKTNDDLLVQYLGGQDEPAAVAEQEGATPTTTFSAPIVHTRLPDDVQPVQLDNGHTNEKITQQHLHENRPASSAQARAQAKLDLKTSSQNSTHTNCEASKRAWVAGEPGGLNPEQDLLARRVFDASAALAELMGALTQMVKQPHAVVEAKQGASINASQMGQDMDEVNEAKDDIDGAEETCLERVDEEDDEEEEEEREQEDAGEDIATRTKTTAESGSAHQSLLSHAHFASASPPPSSVHAGGRLAPRGSRLRRKDTAATGALAV